VETKPILHLHAQDKEAYCGQGAGESVEGSVVYGRRVNTKAIYIQVRTATNRAPVSHGRWLYSKHPYWPVLVVGRRACRLSYHIRTGLETRSLFYTPISSNIYHFNFLY
jgi:hypothetical protein